MSRMFFVTTTETTSPTAAQLLVFAAFWQADLLAEMLSETERSAELARIYKAMDLGFLTITDKGIVELTAKGSAYLAEKG